MSVEFFDGQRREMIAMIRVIAGHLAAEVGKAALDDQSSSQWPKSHGTNSCRSRSTPMHTLTGHCRSASTKTISQPLMVAVMTDLLEFEPDDLVLEIGTGRAPSGGARRVGRPGV